MNDNQSYQQIVGFTLERANNRVVHQQITSPELARQIVANGGDVYAGSQEFAEEIAGRDPIGPELHPVEGENRFPHYRLADRQGGHIFFGNAQA
jgi:hypothetical protein